MPQAPIISSVVSTLLVLSLINGCSKGDIETTPAPMRSVRTVIVAPSDGVVWRELPGVVKASKQAELAFRVPGKLIQLLASEGEDVDAGQMIAQLDATDYRIQFDSRKSEFNQVHSDYVRAQALVDQGMISRSDFGKLESQNATTKANYEVARQNMSNTELKTPFAGRIAKRYMDNYEEVSVMQPVYLLQDLSTLAVKVDVPESVMILIGDRVPPKLSAHFDTIPDQSFPLTLREAATQSHPETNTFEVTLNMSSVEAFNVLPGMSVTVRGERPAKENEANRVFLPAQAVMEDDAGRYVYIAQLREQGMGVVQRRTVVTGELSNLGLQITDGVASGDRVVVAGMSKMFSGLEVNLQ